MKFFPIIYAPDLESSWELAPGTVIDINQFVPLQSGNYATAKQTRINWLEGNPSVACIFPQTAGTYRLIVAEGTKINEYSSTGTRTNRATGLTAGEWQMAAWGNAIIAVSKSNATQVSTGTTFGALSGAPKARHVATNTNFVMLADIDDGGSFVYPDGIWTSGFRDYTAWTPAIRTQCYRARLPEGGGAITAVVAYKEGFVAFKKDGMWAGTYTGAQQGIFQWRPVSRKIGCQHPKSIVEVDGKLFFLHTSGFYQFDGSTIVNISNPIFQTYASIEGLMPDTGWSGGTAWNSITTYPMAAEACGDDIEGNVFWLTCSSSTPGPAYYARWLWVYNARSGKWSKIAPVEYTNSNCPPIVLRASTAELQAAGFTGYRIVTAGGTDFTGWNYPDASTGTSSMTTGVIGTYDKSITSLAMSWRGLYGTGATPGSAASATGYSDETKNTTTTSANGTINTEFSRADFMVNSRFAQVGLSWATGKRVILGGLAYGTNTR